MNMAFGIMATFMLLVGAVQAQTSKPNFIIILTDDHGYSDLGCQGLRQDVRTPNIDGLANNGVRMTQGYATAPQCVPSRAGLLSGIFQCRFGLESNDTLNVQELFMPQLNIAERLKSAGYTTCLTGKWHLGDNQSILRNGFDYVYYMGGQWCNFNLKGERISPGKDPGKLAYHVDGNSMASVAFIEKNHGKPFFLYMAHKAPHIPLNPPTAYLNRFPGKMKTKRRQALATLSAIDDGVGKIIGALQKHNIEDNTVIFFVSDHGAPQRMGRTDEYAWDGSVNIPFRGEKGMLSEGGLRIPYIIQWKGRLAAGRVFKKPVSTMDIPATIMACAGLQPDTALDGVNLLPHINGTQASEPHPVLSWRWRDQSAILSGNLKLLQAGGREMLFDLSNDPGESKDLASGQPEAAQNLKKQLEAWKAQLLPPGEGSPPLAETKAKFDRQFNGLPPEDLTK